ncbi:MAG: HepT-like ribonuclease domain-containing protein [Balneolaceae bacterium]|nr:HepT-like ribonuclease domain-containing protein [Balneolaceae bacterium]
MKNFKESVKSMLGMRDILIHNYMGVDIDVVWKTIDRLPQLRKDLNEILKEMKG